MGRDRFTHHREPCPCGSGSLVVDWTEHDTYGSSGTWEPSVDCRKCSKDLTLAIQDDKVILVERSEVKRREKLSEEAWRIDKKALNSAHGRALRSELAELLEEQPSMAAAHRMMRGAKLTGDSISRFRREVRRGYSEYVDREIYTAAKLPGVARLVERALDPAVSEQIARSSELKSEARQPLQGIGEPIYRLRRMRY